MIEYLQVLIQQEKWDQVLPYAERLLLNSENPPSDILDIHLAILIARVETGEWNGGQISGQLVVRLAHDLCEWDSYGTGTHYLAVAHYRLGQREAALTAWYDYVTKLHLYQAALKYQVVVWYNIGLVHTDLGNRDSALDAYANALDAVGRVPGDPRYAHGVRQAVTWAYIQAGEFAKVPRLLAQSSRYLRRYPNAPRAYESLLWHYTHRAEFAFLTARPQRARSIALVGLVKAEGVPEHQCLLHMIIARVHRSLAAAREAMGHALAARACAIKGRRHDLETQATEFIYQLVKSDGLAVETVERLYVTEALQVPDGELVN